MLVPRVYSRRPSFVNSLVTFHPPCEPRSFNRATMP
ncbi:hypothetical protein QGX15_gp185 [Pseudomonas phage psageK4e]|uniref:Uncharacterized protein n=1 Tax=Pseudomonas phage psageK4e TaxID=2875723 RepID=A0AAE8XQA7_9CAUD|nr:hypothetical protein QGX15_gp185 [Pseudomonas phage psageK4e]UAW53510.1 hypothetical protein psageK4e_062c [Pseudomonas phage psageK4e]